jgi:hypothetical protein
VFVLLSGLRTLMVACDCHGVDFLPFERPIVSHGGHHLDDGSAGRLRVAPIVQQGCVRRPLHDAVDAVGRESGQFVLPIEPTGLLCACSDHRQRFVPQDPRTPQSARLGGGKKLSCGGTHLWRRGAECIDLRTLPGRQLRGRRIELGQQTDYPEPRQQGNHGETLLLWFVAIPCFRSRAELIRLSRGIDQGHACHLVGIPGGVGLHVQAAERVAH